VRRRTLLVGAGLLASAGGPAVESIEDDGFHETDTAEVVVDGSPVDLSADRFQAENASEHDVRFHFHEEDDRWHMERERVTFPEAIGHIPGFEYAREGGAVVTVEDATYDGSDPSTEGAFLVDGERVDPTAYDLQDGDHLRVEITTE
jgi:hypothetical protein